MFKVKYRIVTDEYDGFECQHKRWWFPFWIEIERPGFYSNTHRTLEEARNFIDNCERLRKHRTEIVEYYEPKFTIKTKIMKEEQQEQKLYNVSITPNDPNGIGLNFEAGILLQHYNEDNSIIFVLKSPKKKIQSDDLEFTNTGKKESQKELIKEIMDLDAKDGLYEDDVEKFAAKCGSPFFDEKSAEYACYGFKQGYNKAKETLYTEEDMLNAFYNGWLSKDLIWKVAKKLFKESLKQSKKD